MKILMPRNISIGLIVVLMFSLVLLLVDATHRNGRPGWDSMWKEEKPTNDRHNRRLLGLFRGPTTNHHHHHHHPNNHHSRRADHDMQNHAPPRMFRPRKEEPAQSMVYTSMPPPTHHNKKRRDQMHVFDDGLGRRVQYAQHEEVVKQKQPKTHHSSRQEHAVPPTPPLHQAGESTYFRKPVTHGEQH